MIVQNRFVLISELVTFKVRKKNIQVFLKLQSEEINTSIKKEHIILYAKFVNLIYGHRYSEQKNRINSVALHLE